MIKIVCDVCVGEQDESFYQLVIHPSGETLDVCSVECLVRIANGMAALGEDEEDDQPGAHAKDPEPISTAPVPGRFKLVKPKMAAQAPRYMTEEEINAVTGVRKRY